MSTGKTLYSMISQVTGAALNIVLDYVFIYPMQMGIDGAAYATVIGQIASFALAMVLHYTLNKEIDGKLRYIKPEKHVIKGIYKIGFPAFLMQGMLACMMFGVLLVIGSIEDVYTVNLLTGSYGIYYKLMQTALFASFGLSNTLISVTSYNYGGKAYGRVRQTIKYGILDSILITAVLTLLYQIFATPISNLFALTIEESSIVAKSDVLRSCRSALHIATLGYVFMGLSVAIQGVLQGFNEVYSPLIISALRLLVLPLPLVFLATLGTNVGTALWWAFPISEVVTAVVSYGLLRRAVKKHLPKTDAESAERL